MQGGTWTKEKGRMAEVLHFKFQKSRISPSNFLNTGLDQAIWELSWQSISLHVVAIFFKFVSGFGMLA